MKAESATDLLTRDILLLELKRTRELVDLREQVHATRESLKPLNLIKSIVKGVSHSSDTEGDIGKTAFGVAAGYFLKKLVFGSSANPLKKLAGITFQTLVTNTTVKNSEKIKETSIGVLKMAKALILSNKSN